MKTTSKTSTNKQMEVKPSKTKGERKAQPVDRAHQAEEFPGYPPYSPKDDIMNQGRRVDTNLEESKARNTSDITAKQNRVKSQGITKKRESNEADLPTIDTDADEESLQNNQFAVTDEDLEALGPEDLSLDMGEDEELKHRTRPVDFSGRDLDVPGSELDDASEQDGGEDEENNSYSIGGDNHNDLEEAK